MDMSPDQIARKIITATYSPDAGIFFKGGKETMVMLHIMQDVIGKKLENPFIFLDSGKEQQELYDFIDEQEKEMGMNLHRFPFDGHEDKIRALKDAIDTLNLEKVYVAIRRDESPARKDEVYMKIKDGTVRIHPMLEFSEDDIWAMIRGKNIPYCTLLDQGYRSLGDGAQKSIEGGDERSGRDQDKEKIMERLRNLGYF